MGSQRVRHDWMTFTFRKLSYQTHTSIISTMWDVAPSVWQLCWEIWKILCSNPYSDNQHGKCRLEKLEMIVYNLDMQDKKDTGNGRPKSRNWGQEVGVYLRHRGFLYSFWQPLFNNQSACSAGDQSAIPGSGKSPGEGNGNPLQYSCLENPMDGGAWQATVHGVAKSRTRLSDFALF